jgi:hypothetical protein
VCQRLAPPTRAAMQLNKPPWQPLSERAKCKVVVAAGCPLIGLRLTRVTLREYRVETTAAAGAVDMFRGPWGNASRRLPWWWVVLQKNKVQVHISPKCASRTKVLQKHERDQKRIR